MMEGRRWGFATLLVVVGWAQRCESLLLVDLSWCLDGEVSISFEEASLGSGWVALNSRMVAM